MASGYCSPGAATIRTSRPMEKVDKEKLPEDAFFHLYEMNLDGSGVRQLDARFLRRF